MPYLISLHEEGSNYELDAVGIIEVGNFQFFTQIQDIIIDLLSRT